MTTTAVDSFKPHDTLLRFDRSIEEERLLLGQRAMNTLPANTLYSFFCVVSFIFHRFCCCFLRKRHTNRRVVQRKTFNAIAPTGWKSSRWKYCRGQNDLPGPLIAIMLARHKLQVSEVKPTVRAIVRCGAGRTIFQSKRWAREVFRCLILRRERRLGEKRSVRLLLASRGILEGANHVKNVINVEEKGEHEKSRRGSRRIRQTLAGRRSRKTSKLSD